MNLPKDQSDLLKNLEILIQKTYEVEEQFIEFKNILNGVIEFLPQALWMVDSNEEIIAQNSKAKNFNTIPQIG